MASSQVDIAPTSPFGCVLRKYNHREIFRERAYSSSSSRVSSSSQGSFHNNVDNICNNNIVAPPQVDDVNNNINNNNKDGDGDDGKNIMKKENKEDKSLSSLNNNIKVEVNPSSTRKGKEMVLTIETDAEILENMGSNCAGSNSTSSSETLLLNNRGASSLVQIWEKRLNNKNLNRPSSLKLNTITSRTSSFGSIDNVGETFTDESSSSSSPCSSDWVASDTNIEATASSTPKVADIIKRLKENNYGGQEQSNSSNNNNNNNVMMGSSCLSSNSRSEKEQHTNGVKVHSPRIRGRRALTDLLMQMERDRNGELSNLAQLAPVSNFSKRGRGRIQSLLRLRLLKRYYESPIYEVTRPPKGSTLMHQREKFDIKVKQGGNTTQSEIASSRNIHPDQLENPIPPHNPRGEHESYPIESDKVVNVKNCCHNANGDSSTAFAHKPKSQTNEEEAHPSSSEAVCIEAQIIIASQEVTETSTCNNMVDSGANHREISKEEEDLAKGKQLDNNVETEIIENYEDEITMNIIEDDHHHHHHHHEYASEGINDYDENDDNEEQNYDDDKHYYDWITPIARPRSYWEDRRQAWYKEMLDTASSNNKGEIRQLLERRRVSTFLSSDMRERMDKLMEYHIGTQTQFMSSNSSSSQKDDEENGGGRMGQLMSILQQHIKRHNGHNLEEEKSEKQEAQEEEERLMGDHSSSPPFSSIDIMDSSAPNMSSWSYRDDEASDDSDDRVDDRSSIQSSPSQCVYQHSRQSSSYIDPHIKDMDLIYDMRGQMDQLFREMAEIRKSLKSCIDMQIMLQKSMKHEAHTEVRENTKRRRRSNHKEKAHKKGNCCICYEKKVDSFLYKCGHMCTCSNCANELQWNSGTCPICLAPIADVVRVYVDS